MTDKYILKDGIPTPATFEEWARWFESPDNGRILKQEVVGDAKVSTVFLGLNHNFDPDGPPILWETMIFGGVHDQYQDRCSGNREQAEAMHLKAVKLLSPAFTGAPLE